MDTGKLGLIVFFSMIVGTVLLLSITLSSAFGQEFLNYKNGSIGVQLDYPNDWIYKVTADSIFFSPANESKLDEFTLNQSVLFVVSNDIEIDYNNVPLESYMEFVKSKWETSPAYNLLTNPIKIILNNGLPAYEIKFNSKDGMKQMLLVVVVAHGKPYDIIYTADSSKFNQYLPLVRSMISTLKFL